MDFQHILDFKVRKKFIRQESPVIEKLSKNEFSVRSSNFYRALAIKDGEDYV